MEPNRSVHSVSASLPASTLARFRGRAVVAAAVLAVPLVGCAAKKQMTATPESPEAMPLVISGTPRTDTAAFANANRSLLQAEYGVIDEMGPKPIWRSVPNARDRALSRSMDEGDPERGVPERSSTAVQGISRNTEPGVPYVSGEDQPSQVPYVDAANLPGPVAPDPALQMQPLAGDGAPIEGPLAPQYLQIQPTNDPADARPQRQPVAKQTLPDGRVRLIWHLRSFGGPSITTAQNGGVARRAVNLTPKDLSPLIAVIQAHLADKGTVLPLAAESKLVITCTADSEQGVVALLNDVDIPPPQVEITAKIFEVSHDFDYQQGAKILLNRITSDGSQQALSAFQTERLLDSVQQGSAFQGAVISLMQTFSNAGMTLDAQFELLAEAGLIHVVSSPRLTVAEGQTGYMLAGQELPIQSANIVNNNTQIATSYKPVGVQLYITPQAIGNGMVKLHTVSIVSSVSGFTPLPSIRGEPRPSALFLNPIIDSREAETAVTVPEGETLVISGMRMVRTVTREDKIPGLGDIPILGMLFKSHRSQQRMTDLYFFVTPTLASAAE